MVSVWLCLPRRLQLVRSETCCNYYLVKISFAIYCSFTMYMSCPAQSAFIHGSFFFRGSRTAKQLSVGKVCVLFWGLKSRSLSPLLPSFPTFIFCFFSQIAEHIRIFSLPLHPKIWLRMGRRSTPQECNRPQPMLATLSPDSLMASQRMVRVPHQTA